MMSPVYCLFRPKTLGLVIALILSGTMDSPQAREFEFNTDVLDLNDRKNIDLSQFARGGYIMPGTYTMVVYLNRQILPEQPVMFYTPESDPKSSEACLSPSLLKQLGLREDAMRQLRWQEQRECLDTSSLKGTSARGDLASSTLYLSVPQAYLEYASEDWDPPSRWDEGIPGLLFDYHLNGQTRQQQSGSRGYSLSGNGTAGANLGAWRLRADWQSQLAHQTGTRNSERSWDWSRYYAYRAIPRLRARLTLGEDFLNSSIFDSFRFTGATLNSEDSMLPPNLRGYAPEVTGVARTNAKVVISQQGRVLYETQVAAGPFRIQDLNNAVSGQLDVRVEEQDGQVQTFQVNTANIPYLTRPGSVRYRLSAGRPSDWKHNADGPTFASGEFSWGVSNGWSLYGGGLGGNNYSALSLGIGRDLMAFGALSFDVTQSRARLPQQSQTLGGGSYRISYSKNFEQYDSQVTFAGYRFSERNFMTMAEYLAARSHGDRSQGGKEMYTLTFNKQFRDLGLSASLNYSHQSYWDRPANERYNLSLSRYFDIGALKNLSLSLSAYRNQYDSATDNGVFLSLTIPWNNGSTVNYSSSINRDDNVHRLGYHGRLNERSSYQLSAGTARSGAVASGYFNHLGDMAQTSVNASYQQNRFTSVGMSLQGGATLTAKGGALHRSAIPGGTRLLLDTDGVAGVPVRGYGSASKTNLFGKAVVADVNSYYRNRASIDLEQLDDNAEATRSVVQATLTEGAIGYRRFGVVAGEKAMAVIRLADGSTPPFGATVLNRRKQETGIVNDGGSVYLSGINAGERMTVHWSGAAQCAIALPAQLSNAMQTDLLLPCLPLTQEETAKSAQTDANTTT